MSSRVLVTGGSGSVGVYAMKRLIERGHYVVNYDQLPPSAERAFVLEDVKDKIAFEKASVDDLPSLITAVKKHGINKIVHLAAIVDREVWRLNPSYTCQVNLGGTINVLETARIMDVDRVVNISSIAVFTTRKYEPIDENHPVLQSNEGPGGGSYGASKIGSEAFCWSYRENFGLDFVVLRPSAAYGLGMRVKNNFYPMVESAVKGEPLKLEHGRDSPRDYTYMKDIAQAIQLAVDVDGSRLRDRIFLVASGKLATPGELAEIVKEFIPKAHIEIGEIDESDRKDMAFRGILDIGRATRQLGYEPEFDVRRGIKDYITMCQLYLENMKRNDCIKTP